MQPTLPVLVKKRWSGGNLQPGERARIPSELARGLARIGAVELLAEVAPSDAPVLAPKTLDDVITTPESGMRVEQRAPVAPVADPIAVVAPMPAAPLSPKPERKWSRGRKV